MNELRLLWEPKSLCKKELVSAQIIKYMDNTATFALFENNTCLMLKPVENLEETIKGALIEARRLASFEVYQMDDGDYLVFFASALIVYVGKEEFLAQQAEIRQRVNELNFPSESVVSAAAESDDRNMLVGLYARGKLQRDAWSTPNYTVVTPT